MDKIVCHECGLPMGFWKKKEFHVTYYGNQNIYLQCDCGQLYRLDMNVRRMSLDIPKTNWTSLKSEEG